MYSWHRTRVIRAFDRMFVHESRVFAYMGCGSSAWVMQSESDPTKFAIRANRCHDRWCPACAKSRAMVLRCNLEPLLKGQAVRFITLTLKHSDDTLRVILDRLYDSFAKLRKHPAWEMTVRGGVAFTEVKHNPDTGRWHPHIHIICVGKYLPQGTLKAAWLECTGDSHIVDIRLIRDEAAVARYVTKYVTKPCNNDLYRDDARLEDAIRDLKGRRLVTTFGEWRGHRLLENQTLDDWAPLMRWPELLAKCREHDAFAIDIYRALTRREWVADDTDVTMFERGPPAQFKLPF